MLIYLQLRQKSKMHDKLFNKYIIVTLRYHIVPELQLCNRRSYQLYFKASV